MIVLQEQSYCICNVHSIAYKEAGSSAQKPECTCGSACRLDYTIHPPPSLFFQVNQAQRDEASANDAQKMQLLLENNATALAELHAGNQAFQAEMMAALRKMQAESQALDSGAGGAAAAASAAAASTATDASERWMMGAKEIDFDLGEDHDGLVAKVKLGSGSFGTVYLGEFHSTKVAVKEMMVTVPADVEAFEKEASLTFRLHHPNVVHCHGGSVLKEGADVTAVRIVIEFMRTSLAEELHVKQTPFTEPQRREVILHVARGLSYLHARGVAHRDLKPGNIMQDEYGKYWKLIDFGLSTTKLSSRRAEERAGSTEGTHAYMAPELYTPAGGNHRVDAFAFGVTVWEMYARKRPFEGVAEAAIGPLVKSGKRPDLKAVGESDVQKLILKCWQKKYDKRPKMADVVCIIEQGRVGHAEHSTAGDEGSLTTEAGAGADVSSAGDAFVYSDQLAQLVEMGFHDVERARGLLDKHQGDVQRAFAEIYINIARRTPTEEADDFAVAIAAADAADAFQFDSDSDLEV